MTKQQPVKPDEGSHAGAIQRTIVGSGLIGAGEVAGAKLGARAAKHGTHTRLAAKIAPRGLGAVGVPLAASGLVAIARGHKQQRVSLSQLPKDVAERTVAVPGVPMTEKQRTAPKKPIKQTLAIAGASLAGGQVARKLARRKLGLYGTAAAATAGTAIGAAGATGLAHHFNKADELDVAQYRRKRRNAKIGLATTGLGATALALRAPTLARRGSKIAGFGHRMEHHSNRLAAATAVLGTYGGISSYKASMHELNRDPHRPVAKGDDKFLRRYRNRISPQAESGYTHLKSQRNENAGMALGAGLIGAANLPAILHGDKVTKPIGLATAAVSAASALSHGQTAARRQKQMGKIKSRARQREHAGEWGRDRNQDLAKALVRRPPGLPLPKGLVRAPTMRPGVVRRTADGKQVVVRGSYG